MFIQARELLLSIAVKQIIIFRFQMTEHFTDTACSSSLVVASYSMKALGLVRSTIAPGRRSKSAFSTDWNIATEADMFCTDGKCKTLTKMIWTDMMRRNRS